MKKIFLSALALSLSVLAFAQYEQYYQNLPVEVEQVKPFEFPKNNVVLAQLGAKPDGKTLNTEYFQQAIDSLSKLGGGNLVVTKGVWKTGPIELKSNINLFLRKGAYILFTEDKTQYILPDKKGRVPEKARACITASKCENIGITGKGVIDGQGFYWRPIKEKKVVKGGEGQVWQDALSLGGIVKPADKTTGVWYPWNIKTFDGEDIPNIGNSPEEQEKMRYHLVSITDCKNVIVQGVTLRNSPKFHLVPARIKNLIIDGVTVDCPWWAQNGDAMDIGNTQVCLVVNCNITCGDDGICMKGGVGASGVERGPNRDFLIINDTVNRAHGGFVIGSEFSGGMQRLVVKNCLFDGTDIGCRFKSAPGRGGWCEDIYCEDIVMKDIREQAILFEAGYADRAVGRSATDSDNKEAYFPDWAHFTFRNITSVNAKAVLYACGMKGFPVHDIKFENCNFYGSRAGIEMDFVENFTFTGCSITPAMTNTVKHAKDIIYNGKPLE